MRGIALAYGVDVVIFGDFVSWLWTYQRCALCYLNLHEVAYTA
jgi:hypothetical protein